jgi:DNA-binding TFAR19-related protein (PDSD5 family)
VRRQANAEAIQRRRMDQIHRRTEGVSHTNLSDVITPKASTEHWVPFAERELSGVTILPKGTAAARMQWEPNEVPLPTYVNAPKAIQPKRVIDLTEPGKWSDEQEALERAALAAAAPSRDEIFDQQLADEAVERLRINRAANQ